MILSEPSQTPYDLHFRLFGIPVRVHPMFWLAALVLGLSGNKDLEPMLLWVVTVFISILVHELGHALVARAFGWPPHITLHAFGGLASYRPTFRSPRNQILITLAGPGAGFLFAAAIVAALRLSGHEVLFDRRFTVGLPILFEPLESVRATLLVFDLLYVNIFWGLINLLPVYPLDGGQLANEVLGLVNPRDGLRQSLWLSVIAAAIVAVLAFTKLHDQFLAIFFAYLGYTNYMTLQATFGPGGGFGRFR